MTHQIIVHPPLKPIGICNQSLKNLTMTNDEQKLWNVINLTLWMAIRYAHGRHTAAPYMIREAVSILKEIDPNFKIQKDHTLEVDKDFKRCGGLKSDYLIDLFDD